MFTLLPARGACEAKVAEGRMREVWYKSSYRVGDEVTPVALSHHRTCGSASGGSLDILKSARRIEQRHQPQAIKE
ncbi:hypothetical protein AGMMS50256_02780 [Betaproteobacteria bacterium]|nr:hypothetical protein AGMMS50256_02780 [Betaproteobacteria bacterium]